MSSVYGDIWFDHVGIAVPEKDHAVEVFRDLVGGSVTYHDRPSVARGTYLASHVKLGNDLIEFIEPDGPASFLNRFLERRGPGLHHITWEVSQINLFVSEMEARGLRTADVLRRDGQVFDAFLHPASAHGLLMQFRPANHRALPGRIDHPSMNDLPPPLPSTARLKSILSRVAEPAEACTFFRSIVGGDTESAEVRPSLDAPGVRLEFEAQEAGRSGEQPNGFLWIALASEDPVKIADRACGHGIRADLRPDGSVMLMPGSVIGAAMLFEPEVGSS